MYMYVCISIFVSVYLYQYTYIRISVCIMDNNIIIHYLADINDVTEAILGIFENKDEIIIDGEVILYEKEHNWLGFNRIRSRGDRNRCFSWRTSRCRHDWFWSSSCGTGNIRYVSTFQTPLTRKMSLS